MEQRDKVRFETNIPQTVALKFNDGLEVTGRYGDQILYTLTDDRVMYVPHIVRQKLAELGVRREEEFSICKRESRDGSRTGIEWQVGRGADIGSPEAPATAHHKPAETTGPQHSQEATRPQSTTPPRPPANGNGAASAASPGQPRTRLEDALCTVVSACHAASEYGKQIGFAMPSFTSEDIAKMAMTLTIDARGGGR